MSYTSEVLADSPVGYWRLDDVGGTAVDLSGNGHDGTLAGGITTGVDGALSDGNKAMTFDGSGDINCGNPAAFASANGTLEAWVKTTSNDAGPHQILDKHDAYAVYLSGNVLHTFDWGSSADISGGAVVINDDAWHHVALTYQSGVAGGSQLYVDGVPVGSAFTYTIGDQVHSLTIGGSGLGSPDFQRFVGSLDEVAFYPSALSAARIAAHFAAASGPPSVTWDVSASGASASAGTAAALLELGVSASGSSATDGVAAASLAHAWPASAEGDSASGGTAVAFRALAASASGDSASGGQARAVVPTGAATAWWAANHADFWNRNPYHGEARAVVTAALGAEVDEAGFAAWWEATQADFWNRNPYHSEVRALALAAIQELS